MVTVLIYAAIPITIAIRIIRKLRLCAGCNKKETGCTRASAAETLDLHQVGNGETRHLRSFYQTFC